MSENNIYEVPQEYLVEMIKRCNLVQYQTTHLPIAGAEQGMMHVFFTREILIVGLSGQAR